ncbi:Flp pilus assembly protein CpaB [Halobacteriovorax sp. GB3]|uniref:Flp pilus assembly protein CpaB n=1 Tax=Halobacteriovorax sp. GB3 TaxID=2719615 RepID=UPI002362721C|nr:Flp pilus assembly protein CpaB [Halobacteriovorax sp. GB3]MDD0854554.1 Flp pilus assembly protein CpaB [Halobacteriovorax sp. GB3]
MNTRSFTLALIIAVFAMFMVYTYVEDQKASLTLKYGTMSSVVVAKTDIKEFELLDDSKVTVMNVPQKFLAPGHFKTMREVENTIATVPILKGEQITKPRLTFPGEKTGLSREVSVEKRAIAISITDKQAVSKLIKPGDRVDIIASIDYASGRKDLQTTKTILQDVRVLSTGMSVSNNLPLIGVKTPTVIKKMKLNTYANYNTVTIELDPFQVQKLIFLLTYSPYPPYLSLRNINDKTKVNIGETKIFDVLGDDTGVRAKQFFSEKYQGK